MIWLKALGLSIIAIFMPAKEMLASVLFLIVVDLITGILASRKQGIPITSSAIRRTISKLIIYEVVIMIAFIAQKYLLADSIPASNIVAGLIGITELTSCLENLNAISGDNLLKIIISKIGSANKDETKAD